MTYFVLESTSNDFNAATLLTSIDENGNTSARFVEGEVFTVQKVSGSCYELVEVSSGRTELLCAEVTDYVGDEAWGYFHRKASECAVTGLGVKVFCFDKQYLALVPMDCPLQTRPYLAVWQPK